MVLVYFYKSSIHIFEVVPKFNHTPSLRPVTVGKLNQLKHIMQRVCGQPVVRMEPFRLCGPARQHLPMPKVQQSAHAGSNAHKTNLRIVSRWHNPQKVVDLCPQSGWLMDTLKGYGKSKCAPPASSMLYMDSFSVVLVYVYIVKDKI